MLALVAARLAKGPSPNRPEPPHDRSVELAWPEVQIVPGKIQGSVTKVDSHGNLVTDISEQALADVPRGEGTRVVCGDHETFGIFGAYTDQPPMTLVALVGASGQLELAIVGDSAQIMLGEKAGTKVAVTW